MTNPSDPDAGNLDIGRVSDLSNAVLTEVERAIVGKREPLRLVLAGVLAGGHVLMEDFPGWARLWPPELRADPRSDLQARPVHA